MLQPDEYKIHVVCKSVYNFVIERIRNTQNTVNCKSWSHSIYSDDISYDSPAQAYSMGRKLLADLDHQEHIGNVKFTPGYFSNGQPKYAVR